MTTILNIFFLFSSKLNNLSGDLPASIADTKSQFGEMYLTDDRIFLSHEIRAIKSPQFSIGYNFTNGNRKYLVGYVFTCFDIECKHLPL